MVATTLSKLSGDRRCFRKIGGVLVEKDLATIKNDLNTEIANIKQTLDVVYKTMTQTEAIMTDYEKKYADIIRPTTKKTEKKEDEKATKKEAGGVLV